MRTAIERVPDGAYFTIGEKRYLKLDARNSKGMLFFSRDKSTHGYAVDLETARVVDIPDGVPCDGVAEEELVEAD
jgi:hypothetical protein